jgi:hypothetical protein
MLRCLLALAFLALPLRAEKVAVFLAAGQSNATAPWADGIRQVLQESGRYPRLELVYLAHPGSALFQWFDLGGPWRYYTEDLAAVREAMDGIRAAGDTPVFQGFFWMQGEGDSKMDVHVERYPARFNRMMEQYCIDLNVADMRFALGITDANPDPLYDNPAVLLTTRERVEALRAQQMLLGGQVNGVAVDSRGLARFDAVHLLWQETGVLGRRMGAAWLEKFPAIPEAREATAEEAEAAAKSFRKADRDRDGAVTRAEFRALMKPRQKIHALRKRLGPSAAPAVETACSVVFSWFDSDQTGSLDWEEWVAGSVYDPAVSTPAFHRLPEDLTDRNRDGQHTYKEFAWTLRGLVTEARCEEWYDAW